MAVNLSSKIYAEVSRICPSYMPQIGFRRTNGLSTLKLVLPVAEVESILISILLGLNFPGLSYSGLGVQDLGTTILISLK